MCSQMRTLPLTSFNSLLFPFWIVLEPSPYLISSESSSIQKLQQNVVFSKTHVPPRSPPFIEDFSTSLIFLRQWSAGVLSGRRIPHLRSIGDLLSVSLFSPSSHQVPSFSLFFPFKREKEVFWPFFSHPFFRFHPY